MKILVISDTHGLHDNLQKVIDSEHDYEAVLHLGDTEGWDPVISDMFDVPVTYVAGNCDWASDQPAEKIVEFNGVRILMTHGHEFYVTMRLDLLLVEAKTSESRVALFGHTHRPELVEEEGVLIANPGSLSRPRQLEHVPSYGILTIGENQAVDFEIKYVKN